MTTKIVRRSFSSKRFHVTDDGKKTRCGFPLTGGADGYFYAAPDQGYTICEKCGGQAAVDAILAEQDARSREAKVQADRVQAERHARVMKQLAILDAEVMPLFGTIGQLEPEGMSNILTIVKGGETFRFRVTRLVGAA